MVSGSQRTTARSRPGSAPPGGDRPAAISRSARPTPRRSPREMAGALRLPIDYGRRVPKAHPKEQDQLVLGGVRYRMFTTTSLDYSRKPGGAARKAGLRGGGRKSRGPEATI